MTARDGQAELVRLREILEAHRNFRDHVVPLCAAETPVSDFVRSFMLDAIHESYAMGGPRRPMADNFAAARYVLDLHALTIDLCQVAYGADYADPRPHSGTNAVTTALMTLTSPGDRVLLQTTASGGHSSMRPVCERLGLEVLNLPYDFDRFDVDVGALAVAEAVDVVLFAPSDLIYPSRLRDIDFDEQTLVIHDATQTLGLIASGHNPNPLSSNHRRTLVAGGTHKTLPGPSSGLLLTNDGDLADRLDSELSPKFVRHAHPHHTAALCATLIEHRACGKRYGDRINEFAAVLTRELTRCGVTVLQSGERVSETHQVFVHLPASRLDAVYSLANGSGLTMNRKNKGLFQATGLRIGVQELARYKWAATDLGRLAELIADICALDIALPIAQHQVRELAKLNEFDPELCLPA